MLDIVCFFNNCLISCLYFFPVIILFLCIYDFSTPVSFFFKLTMTVVYLVYYFILKNTTIGFIY